MIPVAGDHPSHRMMPRAREVSGLVIVGAALLFYAMMRPSDPGCVSVLNGFGTGGVAPSAAPDVDVRPRCEWRFLRYVPSPFEERWVRNVSAVRQANGLNQPAVPRVFTLLRL